MSPLSFRARVGSALDLFAFAEANVVYILSDPPLVLHLLTSSQPVCLPVTFLHESAEVGVGSLSKG